MKKNERREKEVTREIKFRGKRSSDGEWIYGDLQHNVDCLKIREWEIDVNQIPKSYVVDENTIGQYTGGKDKNGREMYEGDIVNLASEDTEPFMRNIPLVVRRYPDGQFVLVDRFGRRDFLVTNIVEVIGNIHDNPKLLKTKGEIKNE